jgi:hypothetical protein
LIWKGKDHPGNKTTSNNASGILSRFANSSLTKGTFLLLGALLAICLEDLFHSLLSKSLSPRFFKDEGTHNSFGHPFYYDWSVLIGTLVQCPMTFSNGGTTPLICSLGLVDDSLMSTLMP